MSIDFVGFRFSAVDRFHVQRVAQDKENVLLATQIGKPVLGEDTLYGNPDVFSARRNRTEGTIAGASHVSVQQDLALRIQNTDVHRSRV